MMETIVQAIVLCESRSRGLEQKIYDLFWLAALKMMVPAGKNGCCARSAASGAVFETLDLFLESFVAESWCPVDMMNFHNCYQ